MLMLVGIGCGACTKVGKNITVTGKVIDPNTQEGVPGALVVITHDAELPLYWQAFKRTKQTRTSADGSFEIDALRLKDYYIAASAPDGYQALGWYENGTYTEFKAVKKGKRMNLEYHMTH